MAVVKCPSSVILEFQRARIGSNKPVKLVYGVRLTTREVDVPPAFLDVFQHPEYEAGVVTREQPETTTHCSAVAVGEIATNKQATKVGLRPCPALQCT